MEKNFSHHQDKAASHHEDSSTEGPAEEVAMEHWLNLKTILATASLSSLYLAAIAQLVLLSTVSGSIATSIRQPGLASWVAASLTLSGAVGYVVGGAASDLLGRRWFAISASALLGLGGIVVATAAGLPGVLAGNAIAGLGGGLGQMSLYAIPELVPKDRRGPVLAVVQLVCVPYLVFGSLVANTMAQRLSLSWKAAAWLVTAHGLFTLVFVFLVYRPQAPLATADKSRRDVLKNFDYLGLVGTTVAPTLILVGITFIGTKSASNPHFYGPFVVGLVLLVLLGFHQVYIAMNPLLHPYLFRRVRTFTLLLVITFVGGMLFYSLIGFYPTYLQTVYGDSLIRSGVNNIPLNVGTLVGGVTASILLRFKSLSTRYSLIFGNSIMLVFIALMALPGPDDFAMATGFSFAAGLGIGWSELLAILLVQLSTPDEWIGYATGVLGLTRMMGGTAGIAIYRTVLQSKVSKILPTKVAAAAVGAGLPQTSLPMLLGLLTGQLHVDPSTIPGITPTITGTSTAALRESYMESFRYVWYTAIPFGVVALAAACFTKPLNNQISKEVVQHIKQNTHKNSAGLDAEASHH